MKRALRTESAHEGATSELREASPHGRAGRRRGDGWRALTVLGATALFGCASAGVASDVGASGGASGDQGGGGGEAGTEVGTAGSGGSGGTGGASPVGGSGGSGAGSSSEGGSGGDSGSNGFGGSGGGIEVGGSGGTGGMIATVCGSACGAVELCDPDHLGFDDNCNGDVDEGCECIPGQSHWCFKGDPSKRFQMGCQDGVERCTENGTWGSCQGGKHAAGTGESSCLGAMGPCSDIVAVPFAKVKLSKGTQSFASDADPGSESYSVTCPPGVTPCPGVKDANSTSKAQFQPLQSGQYGVVYKKKVGGVEQSCSYSIYANAGGVRLELSWDNAGKAAVSGDVKGPDLDLHVHRPGTTTPWGFVGSAADDCYFGNCRSDNFLTTGGPGEPLPGPSWFNEDPAAPPPRNWTKYADPSLNLCYSAPRGTGGQWKAGDKGCHNPRLDLDNFACDAAVTDPDDPSFCAPENVNFDEIALNTWVRVGVHYHGVCSPLETHPVVTVYCGGGQVALLGSEVDGGTLKASGYSAPVTFTQADCENKFWLVADVYVTKNECSLQCQVRPLYGDASAKTPLFVTDEQAKMSFGPGYPPPP